MSLLYKPKEEQSITVIIKGSSNSNQMEFIFYSDCGKFGTEEELASFILTPERLLQILSEREDITDDEL